MKKLLSLALLVAALSGCNKEDQKSIAYQVNDASSKAEWKGQAPGHFHVGSFTVTGSLTTVRGAVKSGDFVIPIASIQDFDLPDPVKQQLLDDLKIANFFNLALHPNATFHLTGVAAYSKADTSAIAGANYLLTGDFSMVGQTHSMSFPAKITSTADSVKTEAVFKLDRTKWGMNIYSDPTKPLYILPDVNMHITVQAGRQAK